MEQTKNSFLEKLINASPKNEEVHSKFMEAINRLIERRHIENFDEVMKDIIAGIEDDTDLIENPPIAKPYDTENGGVEFEVKTPSGKEYKVKVTLGGDYEFASTDSIMPTVENGDFHAEDEHHEWVEEITLYKKHPISKLWEEVKYLGDQAFENKILSLVKVDWDEFVAQHKNNGEVETAQPIE